MVKKTIQRLLYGHRAMSETYVDYLRSKGAQIGEDVHIFAPMKVVIDEQYPWLITIGNHVQITEGVKILTHDYSWAVLKRLNVDGESGAVLGRAGKICIGDNVFLGMNTVVLAGSEIGNSVIVGAGSVVSGQLSDGGVYAGVPAKRLMSVEAFFEKRSRVQLEEARMLAVEYQKRFGKKPPEEIFHEFFPLFSSAEVSNPVFLKKTQLCGNAAETMNWLAQSRGQFSGFDEFIQYCLPEEQAE